MRIRSLEIAGFKSFAHRSTLVFDGGVSAIVGPNGCGKSNIVDAIRWVMGEQNPRLLRGRRMEDLIFGGSQSRQPSGLAEVVLTLDNSDSSAPGAFKDFPEIQIGRRLYRSGESEYLINKVGVRLRDVLDFFLDTGIGTRGYTIVEQGAIATIVSSRPEDRRSIFEEAAGIGKYRARRAETQSKLRSTQQNLTRVSDVLGELQRQRDSLERQARRARRHKELSARLRDLELSVTCVQYAEGQTAARELEAELERLRVDAVAAGARSAQLEADLESERTAHQERDRELSLSGEKLYEVRSQIQSLESRFEFERRECEGLRSLIEQREQELATLAEQLERGEAQRQSLEGSLAESEAAVERAQAQVAERESSRGTGRETLRELSARRDAARSRAAERARETAVLSHRRESLTGRREEEQRALAQLDEQLELSRAESERLEEELERLAAELNVQDEVRQIAAGELEQAQSAQAQAREREQACERQLQEARTALGECGALLGALEEQERRAAARVDEVVATLPEEARSQVKGQLWRALEVDEGLEVAAEAALSAHAEALLFGSIEAALSFIDALREGDQGRASGLVIPPRSVPTASGFVPLGRPLRTRVRASGELQPLVERLLQDVYVVDSLAEVTARFGSSDLPASFVTPAGDWLERSGVMTGGRPADDGGIRRSAELRRRRAERTELGERLAALERQLREASEQRIAAAAQVERARESQHRIELSARDLDKDAERARERLEAAGTALERRRAERAARGERLEQIARELEEVVERADAAESERGALEAEASEIAAQVEACAAEAQSLESALGEARVALAEIRARRDEQRSSAERLTQEVAQHRSWIEQRREEVRTAREREAALASSSQEAEREISTRVELEARARAEQEQLRERFETGASAIAALEQSSREAGAERARLQERIAQGELGAQEMRLRLDQQRERMRDRYSVDIASYTPPELAEPVEGEQREAELKKLRASLESLGGVNEDAIEEYEGVAERHRYLSEQKADLEVSVERLQSAIARINRTSRQRFRETFEAVNEAFVELFPRMFRGGRAHLTLTESEDVLEAGIEIHAQPPGKRLQTVNLLSGGEKALTALALLMAVFRVRPSPFFLLDEVDAALDDANVARFDNLLREMASHSQFLVITHNQSSISSADTLFGVTMQQPGLSQLVTVDLVERERIRSAPGREGEAIASA